MHAPIRQRLAKLCSDLKVAECRKQGKVLVSTLAGFLGHLFCIDAKTMNWGKVFLEAARVIGCSSTYSISNTLKNSTLSVLT